MPYLPQHRIIGNIWNKPFEEALFYKGYGKTAVNPALLAYCRRERIIGNIAVYVQKILLTKERSPDRLEWYKEFLAQFDPQGVVAIALKER